MPPLPPPQRLPPTGPTITLAVVGDVHSQWTADDEAALAWLRADAAVFVGDFGEEDVALVRRLAALPHPKAAVLGNHDAWFSLTPSGRRRYQRAMLASSSLAARSEYTAGGSTPAIAAQLAALGGDHIGYGRKRFGALGLTLLGGRPFSKGGKQWSDVADFYAEHYGVGGHRDSALRLLDQALAAESGDCKVVVAHNGPTGLGGRRHSICGVDWTEPEADFGDPDLQEALDMMHSQGLHIPLVLFGHMHSQLAGGEARNMAEADPRTGTVYLNAATVPRVRSLPVPQPAGPVGGAVGDGSSGAAGSGGSGGEERMHGHHFLVAELRGQVVTAARDVWVGVRPRPLGEAAGSGRGSRQCVLLRQQELLRTAFPPADGQLRPAEAVAAEPGGPAAAAAGPEVAEGRYVCSLFRAHSREWEPVVLPLPALAPL